MRLPLLIRKLHSWVAIATALPLLIVIATGLLLQVKKSLVWVQPAELSGTVSTEPVGLDDLVASLRAHPNLGVRDFLDIERMDVRPDKGIAKVRLGGSREVQLDLATGAVLQVATRRSDLIEALHDGSWFGGDATKLGVFLPAALCLLVLWVTGVWLFYLPYAVRRRRRGVASAASTR